MELFGVGERSLHGMIWSTRFFFMLAGRFPVLMFSFIMRTLVSFWQMGRKTDPRSESLCPAAPSMVLGRADCFRWCIREQNNTYTHTHIYIYIYIYIFFFFFFLQVKWSGCRRSYAHVADGFSLSFSCYLCVCCQEWHPGQVFQENIQMRGKGGDGDDSLLIEMFRGGSVFLPTLNSSSRPSLSWGALVLWSLCRWPSREHTSSSVSPYRKYSSRAW